MRACRSRARAPSGCNRQGYACSPWPCSASSACLGALETFVTPASPLCAVMNPKNDPKVAFHRCGDYCELSRQRYRDQRSTAKPGASETVCEPARKGQKRRHPPSWGARGCLRALTQAQLRIRNATRSERKSERRIRSAATDSHRRSLAAIRKCRRARNAGYERAEASAEVAEAARWRSC